MILVGRLYAHKELLAATANALLLRKCLRQRMWDDSQQQGRQLRNVGRQMSERLAAKGIATLRQLAAADARRIEIVTQRNYPFGTPSISPAV